ncbi:tumor necrosis factor ligand superfamily member 18 [Lates japonicus]|uniref:Tumor necrosis factor ligand superfamily member 18 n=1 Tax=Lates japonicus TaxID=270547 RepID=A0AAD3M964_LATJO|nr:tumor necrosis factor ligand superfamily member 18 [Lates japonicus]
MPHHSQHSLIHVLLLWTTILSVIQVSFIIFFFTAGHHGPSQNSSAVEPGRTLKIQVDSTPAPLSRKELRLGMGKMLTFENRGNTKWFANKPDSNLISEGEVLAIKKDGYYFLNLQVTVCDTVCMNNHTVRLVKKSEQSTTLLLGWTNTKSCTTGLLGKVVWLSAGYDLEVMINPTPKCIISDESQTHLDIIYIEA